MGTGDISLDVAGNLVGIHSEDLIVYDVTGKDTQIIRHGALHIGPTEFTLKGTKGFPNYGVGEQVTIPFADIQSVTLLPGAKKASWNKDSVRVVRKDGRAFRYCNYHSEKLATDFSAILQRELTERIAAITNAVVQAKQQKAATLANPAKLKDMMAVSKRLPIARIASALGLTVDEVWDHIYDWAKQFGFTIDNDLVDFSAANATQKDDFIAQLNKEFETWGQKAAGKEGKV